MWSYKQKSGQINRQPKSITFPRNKCAEALHGLYTQRNPRTQRVESIYFANLGDFFLYNIGFLGKSFHPDWPFKRSLGPRDVHPCTQACIIYMYFHVSVWQTSATVGSDINALTPVLVGEINTQDRMPVPGWQTNLPHCCPRPLHFPFNPTLSPTSLKARVPRCERINEAWHGIWISRHTLSPIYHLEAGVSLLCSHQINSVAHTAARTCAFLSLTLVNDALNDIHCLGLHLGLT